MGENLLIKLSEALTIQSGLVDQQQHYYVELTGNAESQALIPDYETQILK